MTSPEPLPNAGDLNQVLAKLDQLGLALQELRDSVLASIDSLKGTPPVSGAVDQEQVRDSDKSDGTALWGSTRFAQFEVFRDKSSDTFVLRPKQRTTSTQKTNADDDCPSDCFRDCGSDCNRDCASDCFRDCPSDCRSDCGSDCRSDCGADCRSDCGSDCFRDCGADCFRDSGSSRLRRPIDDIGKRLTDIENYLRRSTVRNTRIR